MQSFGESSGHGKEAQMESRTNHTAVVTQFPKGHMLAALVVAGIGAYVIRPDRLGTDVNTAPKVELK